MQVSAANALTAVRILLAPAFVLAVWLAAQSTAARWLACAAFIAAAASDVFDGIVARRAGNASNAGRTFDHFADIVFLLAAFSAGVRVGIVPWWVPAAIAVSFAFYAVDSWLRPSAGTPSLIGSRIGHSGGVANYVILGVVTFNDTTGWHLLPSTLVYGLFCLVPLYSTAAILSRVLPRTSDQRSH